MDRINLQQTHQSTTPEAESSNLPRTLRSRISSIFHKKDTFEKKFSKRLDKTISLSTKVSTHENTYKLVISIWNTLDNDTQIKREAKGFIKKFNGIINKEQKSMGKLLGLITNHEDLSKALQMIDSKLEFTTESSEKLGIAKIKDVINKTFNLEGHNEAGKAVNPNKFVPILSTIPEEEEPRMSVIIHSTKI